MADMENLLLHLWFNNIEGVGKIGRRKLLQKFGTIQNVYNASANELCNVLENNSLLEVLNRSRNMKRIEQLYNRIRERNIWFTYPGDEAYPEKLSQIYDPPDILYIKGILKKEINIYNNCIGIVGARRTDTYGREMAKMFARELAKSGITIISGLARGIDSMAHRGALDAGGYTVAVLGCGINVTYPPENAELFSEIEKNGAIVSEYGLDISPNPGFFPLRNRIISGLSDGVLVVEARKKSGSLITADAALEQGRQVYAVPGRVFDLNSEGTNNLIKQGAECVTSPGDILMDLKRNCQEAVDTSDKIVLTDETHNEMDTKNVLAPAEKKVYSCLGLEPVYIDDIIRISRMGITQVISILYILEEKKIIKQPVRGYYIIAV